MDSSILYRQLLVEFLTSPYGVMAIAGFLVLGVISLVSPTWRWILIAGALYAATLPVVGQEGRTTDFSLAFPLEQIRVYARPLTLILLIVATLSVFVFDRGWRLSLIAPPMWLFLLFQFGIVVRLVATEGQQRGVLTLGSVMLLVVSILICASSWTQTYRDVHRFMWAILGATSGVLAGTLYQLAVDRSQIVQGNRLFGVTGNPQYFAIILSFSLPIALYLLNNTSLAKWRRTGLLALIGLLIVMLLWTGSRTGALSATVGTFFIFYRRMGRFIIVGSVIVMSVLVIGSFYEESFVTGERLLSTTDTRSAMWRLMWDRFMENPVWGTSGGRVEVVENSYLSMLGSFGLVGTAPFAISALMLVSAIVYATWNRRRLGKEAALVDCMTGMWAAIAVTSMFEGILLGVLTYPILLVYCLAALSAFVLDAIRVSNEPLPMAGSTDYATSALVNN